MRERMSITREAIDAMVDHARREAPNECCGLLLGTSDRVDEARPARNLKLSPTRYLIDPEDQFRTLRDARARGRLVCGAYHSHPRGPSAPSPTDIEEANDASLLHVVVSLAPAEASVQAYRIDGGLVIAVALVPDR